MHRARTQRRKRRGARGTCAYCGQVGKMTAEHMLQKSLWDSRKDTIVSPALGRHRLGMNLTLVDVCSDCNNGSLSRLDAFAKSWIDGEVAPEDSSASGKLLRWCAKYAYNASRGPFPDGAPVRPLPEGLASWILGRGEAPRFRAAVGWVHPDHAAAREFSYATGNHPARDATLHVRQWIFCLAWSHPGERHEVGLRMKKLVRRLKVQELVEGQALNARQVPRYRYPDELFEGLLKSGVAVELEEQRRRQPH